MHFVSATPIAQSTSTASDLADCGHRHRTARTAEECRRIHADGCASQGGYSQRRVYAIDATGAAVAS